MIDNKRNSASNENRDDEIIGLVFKRSLIALLVLLMLATVAWLVSKSLDSKDDDVQQSDLIPPQPVEVAGLIAPPMVKFTDVTQAAGITHTHFNGAYGERLLPETMGGGVAVLDYNNDGASDLLFVNGRAWPWHKAGESQHDEPPKSSLILYQGDGAGNFVDVTAEVSLQTSIYGMGAAVGDYDEDGDVDIFVSAVGSNRLYRNVDGERFEDVSEEAGISGSKESWSTGAGFIDYDRDGDLDLAVLNYVRWSREIDLQADYQLTGIGRAYGPPTQFAGTNSYLYRNDGDGRFSDVSAEVGIQVSNASTGLPVGKGLALLPTDVDNDGWLDLVVANDMVRNFLFKNNRRNGFDEVGVESGVAFDNTGSATGAMGIDGRVLSQSGQHLIAIGNFGNEMTSLYVRPSSSPLFTDQAIVSGVGPASRRAVTFGLFFFDYDLDGRLDLLQVNGHIENEINVVEPGQQYEQAPQLFWNCGSQCPRQFLPVSLQGGNDLSQPIVGRAAAYTDIDQDGDLDLILTQISGPPKLLRNEQNTGHNWVQIEVLNDAGAQANGAKVEVVTAEDHQQARVEPTRSYLSQVESVLSFGLGKSEDIEILKVSWPDGTTKIIKQPAINTRHQVKPD